MRGAGEGRHTHAPSRRPGRSSAGGQRLRPAPGPARDHVHDEAGPGRRARPGVTALAVGTDFTRAVLGGGAVCRAGGANHRGQLGTGTTTDVPAHSVVGLTRGHRPGCRRRPRMCRSSRSGKCWVSTSNGQLGNRTAVAASRPDAGRRAHLGVAWRVGGICRHVRHHDGRGGELLGLGDDRRQRHDAGCVHAGPGPRPDQRRAGLGFGWFHACAVTGTERPLLGTTTTTLPARRRRRRLLTPTQVTGLSSSRADHRRVGGHSVPHHRRAWSGMLGLATPTGSWEQAARG